MRVERLAEVEHFEDEEAATMVCNPYLRSTSVKHDCFVSYPDHYHTKPKIPNVLIVEGLVLECKQTLDGQICSKQAQIPAFIL